LEFTTAEPAAAMRLINTRTLEFEEFYNEDTTPGYAILSHTWSNNKDEVTYQD
jgi:hypothetical protein